MCYHTVKSMNIRRIHLRVVSAVIEKWDKRIKKQEPSALAGASCVCKNNLPLLLSFSTNILHPFTWYLNPLIHSILQGEGYPSPFTATPSPNLQITRTGRKSFTTPSPCPSNGILNQKRPFFCPERTGDFPKSKLYFKKSKVYFLESKAYFFQKMPKSWKNMNLCIFTN